MTISSIVPVNNYTGNSSTDIFDFDFLIEDENELVVQHYDPNKVITTLQLGVDYSIAEVGNKNGSYITFPIEGSKYKTLSSDEKISLALALSIKQESEFHNSSHLNLDILEWTFDYIIRILQILNRKVERSFKVQEGYEQTLDEWFEENADKVVKKTLGFVSDSANTCIEKAQESEEIRNETYDLRNQTEELYFLHEERFEFGFTQVEFDKLDWQKVEKLYELNFDDFPFINSVYRKSLDGSYEEVINVNKVETDTGVKIVSRAPFSGHIFKSVKVPVHTMFIQDAESDVWSITHNLRRYPCVTSIDTAGTVVVGTVVYTSLNALEIHFENPIAGKVILN